MSDQTDTLSRMIDDLEKGRRDLNTLSKENPLNSVRNQAVVSMLLTAYRYLSDNLQVLYQTVKRS